MYRISDIRTSWKTLVGMKQHYDTSEFTIADSLTVSEDEVYYQDFHPLITLDNLKSIAPDFNSITYPTWSSTVQYRVGDRTTSNSRSYRAKLANIDKLPETNPAEWERFDPFSEWLEEKIKASDIKSIQHIWSEKLAAKTAKSILESKAIFNGAGRLVDTILNSDSVVGFEIVPARSNGVSLRIDKIGLQFTLPGKYVIYIMHSSLQYPFRTVEVEKTLANSMEWFTMDNLILPYVSDENDAGGSWYLVYDQLELPTGSKAINRDLDWSARPCSGCDAASFSGWQIWSQYCEFHPFKVLGVERGGDFNNDFNSDFFTDPIVMWDQADMIRTYSTNYGINLQITLECDYTDIFVQQRKLFQNIKGLQFASIMMREMAFNPNARITRNQQVIDSNRILYELDGDSQGYKKSGINYQLEKAYNALDIDFTSLSRICFPCKNNGIKYRST